MISNNIDYLCNKTIASLLIDGDLLPYKSAETIESIADFFQLNIKKDTRWKMMLNILNKMKFNNQMSELLNFLLSNIQLRPFIENALNSKLYINGTNLRNKINITGNKLIDIDNIAFYIKKNFIDKINDQLLFNKCRLIDNNDTWYVSPLDSVPIFKPNKRIDYGYIHQMLQKGISELNENDDNYYDDIVTKSRTILESVFKQILNDRKIQYKENGNIHQYFNKVKKSLIINIKTNWNPRVKKLLSSLEEVINSISEMRNKDSDAHDSSKKIKIKKGEAELILYTASSVGTYYLRLNDRMVSDN